MLKHIVFNVCGPTLITNPNLKQVGLNGTMEFIKEVIPAVPDFTIR